MKRLNFIFILSFLSIVSYGQSVIQTTKVKIDVIIPDSSKQKIEHSDELIVHLVPLSEKTKSIPDSIIAKKIGNETFEFELPNVDYFRIGFEIGKFHVILNCIYNEDGQVFEEYHNYIGIRLEEGEYPKVLFSPPCF